MVGDSQALPCSNKTTTMDCYCKRKERMACVLGSAQLVKTDRPTIQVSIMYNSYSSTNVAKNEEGQAFGVFPNKLEF
uniref:EB domain-containing protein n=1 Tax=Angiostrongylus cantonensis TaxID=6313 RepID=A0A0K0DGH1_ANGCA